MSDETVIILAKSLQYNHTLIALDLHSKELMHQNITKIGIKAILNALMHNNESVLCKLDVSADDGQPDISKKLQKNLTNILIRNSKRINNKYLKFAKMKVYENHSNY